MSAIGIRNTGTPDALSVNDPAIYNVCSHASELARFDAALAARFAGIEPARRRCQHGQCDQDEGGDVDPADPDIAPPPIVPRLLEPREPVPIPVIRAGAVSIDHYHLPLRARATSFKPASQTTPSQPADGWSVTLLRIG
jgi:hypothetical protein